MIKKYQCVEENKYGQSVGAVIQNTQPIQFKDGDLFGSHVNLLSLKKSAVSQLQLDQLWQATQSESDDRCWTYLPYAGFKTIVDLKLSLDRSFDFPESIHYLIEVKGKIVGWIALLNIRSQSQAVEIGNVYFSHLMKQSTAATEAIYLLLKCCFEQGFRRVEWKCDDLNQPSKRAALRYGFQFEGVFRQDRIAKGRNRNTAWFSMLDEEWLLLDKAYQAWLSIENFDEQAQQKLRLSDFMKLYQD